MLRKRLLVVAFCILVVIGALALAAVDQWWTGQLSTLIIVVAVIGLIGVLLPGAEEPAVPQDPAAGPTVRIDAVGDRWIEVIKEVRGATGLGLVPVKQELEREPARFVVRSLEDAEDLRAELERRGAVAVVETPGGRAGFGV